MYSYLRILGWDYSESITSSSALKVYATPHVKWADMPEGKGGTVGHRV